MPTSRSWVPGLLLGALLLTAGAKVLNDRDLRVQEKISRIGMYFAVPAETVAGLQARGLNDEQVVTLLVLARMSRRAPGAALELYRQDESLKAAAERFGLQYSETAREKATACKRLGVPVKKEKGKSAKRTIKKRR